MAALEMTKEQAIKYAKALADARRSCVSQLEAVRRKRSWRASEKAMAIADFTVQLNNLTELHERLQEAAGIGGY